MKNLIVDARNFCHKARLGGKKAFANKHGVETTVVYVSLQMINNLLNLNRPDRLIFAWDGGKTSEWRRQIFPGYKKNDETYTEEQQKDFERFNNQIDELRDNVLPFLPVYQLRMLGYEADDLIYAFCQYLKDDDNIIVSSDKDFLQLLNDNISVLDSRRDEALYTRDDFIEEYGFTPDKFVYFRAMVGDTSDKINGVKGIGHKTAEKILQDFEDFDDFLESDEIEAKYRKSYLENNIELFIRNVFLMDLSMFPATEIILGKIEECLSSECSFNEHGFKDYLINNTIHSVLSSFQEHSKNYKNLCQE